MTQLAFNPITNRFQPDGSSDETLPAYRNSIAALAEKATALAATGSPDRALDLLEEAFGNAVALIPKVAPFPQLSYFDVDNRPFLRLGWNLIERFIAAKRYQDAFEQASLMLYLCHYNHRSINASLKRITAYLVEEAMAERPNHTLH